MTRLTRISILPGLVAGILGFATLAFGQKGGIAAPTTNPTTPTPGNNVPNPGLPGNNPNNTNPNYPNNTNTPTNRFPDQTRPIFLSGKVMLEDGTPPPESVTIEKVCNGNPRAQGYTDSKGRFSFQ